MKSVLWIWWACVRSKKRLNNITSFDKKKSTTSKNDEIWVESATREKLKQKTESVRFSCFASEALLIVRRYQKRGIKIAHFFFSSSHFIGFCPPPKMHHALWILNSNHYASATGRQTQESWSASTDIAECEMLVMALHGFRFSFAPYFFFFCVLLLIADISADSTREMGEAHQQKTEYFHYVLQNITHSVFAACTNSRNVDFARVVNFGIAEYFHNPTNSPCSSLNRCLFESFGMPFGNVFCIVVKYFFILKTRFIFFLILLRCCTLRTNLRKTFFFSFWFLSFSTLKRLVVVNIGYILKYLIREFLSASMLIE